MGRAHQVLDPKALGRSWCHHARGEQDSWEQVEDTKPAVAAKARAQQENAALIQPAVILPHSQP